VIVVGPPGPGRAVAEPRDRSPEAMRLGSTPGTSGDVVESAAAPLAVFGEHRARLRTRPTMSRPSRHWVHGRPDRGQCPEVREPPTRSFPAGLPTARARPTNGFRGFAAAATSHLRSRARAARGARPSTPVVRGRAKRTRSAWPQPLSSRRSMTGPRLVSLVGERDERRSRAPGLGADPPRGGRPLQSRTGGAGHGTRELDGRGSGYRPLSGAPF